MSAGLHSGLTATKLRPPLPPARLVRRPRLDDVLDAGTGGRGHLVLVSAPAGSGKSTLLASWLGDRDGAVAWLQLEESDSDPARFWSYLVRAVGRVHPVDETVLQAVVAASGGDEQIVIPALVNALVEVDAPLVVVLDDYHLIDSAAVHRGAERLVELCPAQVTVVLVTRVDPPFRLGRLRVRQQLTEVRGADLRFHPQEAVALLGLRAGSLGEQHLIELCERTEGWAAGLVLAGLSLDRSPDPTEFIDRFRGDDQLVVEYLRDELLRGLQPAERVRLLETSVLEQLTGPLVDAVTDSGGGAAWLRATSEANQLLVALDSTGTWFRYHHLLRDLLRLEAQQEIAELLPLLHSRAAGWFESEGDRTRALGHRLAAGEDDAAARLLRSLGPRLLALGQTETLRAQLDQLGERSSRTTWGALLYAWVEFFAGRHTQSDRWLDTLAELSPPCWDPTPATAVRMNNAFARGDLTAALGHAQQTSGRLAVHSCTVAAVTGVVHAWAGQHEQARRALRLAADKAVDEHIPTVHLMALVHLSVVELDGGSTAGAHAAAGVAVAAAEQSGLTSFHGVAPAYAVRARTGHDSEADRADAEHAVATARRASTPIALAFVLATAGDTLLDLGDPAGALLLAQARAVLDELADPGIASRYLARAASRHGLEGTAAPRATELVEQLTEREAAVLRYLPSGMSQRDIAAELYISMNTVKTHCQAVYRKLGATDRKAAVQTARDLRLL
jgi:LuxR family transcriptional regulator, maltose regulon positive regulatory protein